MVLLVSNFSTDAFQRRTVLDCWRLMDSQDVSNIQPEVIIGVIAAEVDDVRISAGDVRVA